MQHLALEQKLYRISYVETVKDFHYEFTAHVSDLEGCFGIPKEPTPPTEYQQADITNFRYERVLMPHMESLGSLLPNLRMENIKVVALMYDLAPEETYPRWYLDLHLHTGRHLQLSYVDLDEDGNVIKYGMAQSELDSDEVFTLISDSLWLYSVLEVTYDSEYRRSWDTKHASLLVSDKSVSCRFEGTLHTY